jgi:DNA-directed RNA polymerase subunit M/transcription elongation factor TFIIS
MFSKKVFWFGFVFLLMANVLIAQDYTYVGALKCKMCHNSEKSGFQYKIWSESLHAKALSSLSSPKSLEYAKANNITDPSKDAKCLKCHSTAGSVNADKIETLTVAEGVSCESCHGPGSAYKSMNIMKNHDMALKNGLIVPTKEVCEKCHNKENPFYIPFDFEANKAKIAHPRPKAE